MRDVDQQVEREAFEAAYRAHYWQVVAYAARRLGAGAGGHGGGEAARDAAQETFAVAWRRRAELPDAPLPWLYAVAANVVRNAERGRRREDRLTARLHAVPGAPGVAVEPAAPAAPAAVSHEADDDPVRRALARLSVADQEVLRLAAWEDMAPADMARVLGCSPNTAAARLSRAKKRLRAALDEPHSGGATARRLTRLAPGEPGLDQEVRRA